MGRGGEGAIFPSWSLFFFKITLLSFLNYFLKFYFFAFGCAGPPLPCGLFSGCAEWGYSLGAVPELLVAVVFLFSLVSLVAGTGSSRPSAAMAPGL